MTGSAPQGPPPVDPGTASDVTETGPPPQAGPTPNTVTASRVRLRAALTRLRDEMDFDTASLFIPESSSRWHLAERVGATHSWHIVLDPDLVHTLSDGGIYDNARTIPGIGLRLAGLGCGSMAVVQLPGGARVVCDSPLPRPEGGLRTVPPAALAAVAEALSSMDEPLRDPAGDALTSVRQMGQAMRRVLEVPGYATGDFLQAVRDVLGLESILLVLERDDDIEVVAPADERWAGEIPSTVRAIFRVLPPSDPVLPEAARRLAVALGLPDEGTYTASYCQDEGERELLLVGGEAQIPSETVRTAASLVGATRVSLAARAAAVDTHLNTERRRWAHEIHDGVTQSVTSAVIQLEALRERFVREPQTPAGTNAILDDAQEEIRRSLGELRGLLADLVEDGTVNPAPTKPLEALVDDIVKRWRLPARVTVHGDVRGLHETTLAVAHVVIREALTNAAKHAAANTVSVSVVAAHDGLTIEVKDSGRGFNPQGRPSGRGHIGLGLMRQRVADAGGTLDITSEPGRGTRVLAFLPTGEHRGAR